MISGWNCRKCNQEDLTVRKNKEKSVALYKSNIYNEFVLFMEEWIEKY